MSKPFYRFCIFNGIGLALFVWAWMLGYVRQVFEGDVSHISYIISVLFICALIRAVYACFSGRSTAFLDDVETWLVTLGLIGNVVGFVLALRGIDLTSLSQAEGAQRVASQLLAGMGVAFYSTLVGAVLALWLSMGRRVLN